MLKRLAEGSVRCIAMRCAGFDLVDVAAAQELSIYVVRVPTYSPSSIAEHSLALALALNRQATCLTLQDLAPGTKLLTVFAWLR